MPLPLGFPGKPRTSNMGAMLATSIEHSTNQYASTSRGLVVLLGLALAVLSGCSTGSGQAPDSSSAWDSSASPPKAAAASASIDWRYGEWPEAVGETPLQIAVRDADNDPDSFDAQLALCEARASYSAWFAAASACKRASVLRPQLTGAHQRLVSIYWNLRSYDRCRDSAATVAELAPNHAETRFLLGRAHHKLGQNKLAATQLRKAVELAPQRISFYPELILSLVDLGRLAEANKMVTRANEMSPGDERLEALKKKVTTTTDQRLAALQRLIIQEPENPAAYAFLAQGYAGLGFFQEALENFNRALSLMPAEGKGSVEVERLRSEVYYNRGSAYRDLNQNKPAIADIQTAARLEPELAGRALYSIGLIYLGERRAAAAVKALEGSVAKAPAVAENREALARAYDGAGRKADAKKMRESAAALKKPE